MMRRRCWSRRFRRMPGRKRTAGWPTFTPPLAGPKRASACGGPTSRNACRSWLQQLTLDPVDLAGDVFDDVTRLEMLGQHVPRVGFDLEVRRERRFLVERQRLLEREARRPERAQIVEEHGDVEVRTPFARTGILVPVLERVLEVEEPRHLPVFLLAGL